MKGRKGKAMGGVNDAADDLKSRPGRRDNAPKIEDAAEAKKGGGKVMGAKSKMRGDRKPRKNGGRAGSDGSPFTSARKGTPAVGRHDVNADLD